MDTSVIDVSVFNDLRDAVGNEFARELVDTFLEEAPGMLRQLRAALAGSGPAFSGAAAPAKGLCLRRVAFGRNTGGEMNGAHEER